MGRSPRKGTLFVAALCTLLQDRYGKKTLERLRRHARKAESVMQEMGIEEPFTLEEHVLPRLELLDSVLEGIGGEVLVRYPQEFFDPDAEDVWNVFFAFLESLNFTPDMVETLVKGRPGILAYVVRRPDACRSFFEWMRSIGCDSPTVVKIIWRFPPILKLDVETALKPRYAALLALGISPQRAQQGLVRAPTLLGVDPQYLQGRVEYLQKVGLSLAEVGALVLLAPNALLASVESKLEPLQAFLREHLGCSQEEIVALLARGRLTNLSEARLRDRIAGWASLGFDRPALRRMLKRYANLLRLSPLGLHARAKLAFLEDGVQGLGCSRLALVGRPQLLSYSLPRRLGPRTAAARAIRGRQPSPHEMGLSDAEFCRVVGVEPEVLAQYIAAWQASPQGKKWVDMLEGRMPMPELRPLTPEDLQLLVASRRKQHKNPLAAAAAMSAEE